MKKGFLTMLSALMLIVTFSAFSYGAGPKLPEASEEFYVYDESGVIDSELKAEIIESNKALRDSTGAQVVVAVVNNTAGSADIKEYGSKLFEKWQIGDAEKDNGVLMLVSMEDRKLWIEVGYGLEGALPDGKVGDIMDSKIIPSFKDGLYGEGIRDGFNAIVSVVYEEYGMSDGTESSEDSGGFGAGIVFAGLGIVAVIVMLIRKGPKGGGPTSRNYSKRSSDTSRFGGGGFHNDDFWNDNSSSDFGGGFSDNDFGGGGSSGGGGAERDW